MTPEVAEGGAASVDPCAAATPGVTVRMLNQLPGAGGAPAITAYDVSYPSIDGTRVHGQLCVPSSPGPHPIAVFNHGGAAGLGASEWGAYAGNQCQLLAASGYLAVMAQYRGERDRGTSPALGAIDIASEGAIEVCGREIDDILALVQVVQRRCDASPEHVVMYGVSHGGCLGLQAARRHPRGLRAVAAFVAPTDIAELDRYHRSHAAGGSAPPDACALQEHQYLSDLFMAAIGDPDANAAAYAERSPIHFAAEIAPVPTMLIYGGADCSVPPLTHGCPMRKALAAAGAPFVDLHLDATGQSTTAAVPGCEGPAWSPWPGDDDWSKSHYFLFLDGETHGLPGASGPRAALAAGRFLLAHQ